MLEIRVHSFLRKETTSLNDLPDKGAKELLREFFEKELILLRRADPIYRELRAIEQYNPKQLFSLIARKGCQSFDYGE